MDRRIAIMAIMAAMMLLPGCANQGPTDLRCEHQDGNVLVEPGSAPRMSWINHMDQSAYEIEVSVDKDVVWNSGKVPSDESHLVPYAGPATEPMKDYTWKVRTWDKDGKVSGWSEPAR